ncbi:peptidoglycan D,D-transpeptidase FtsI family protein [Planctomicrobium sp. SH661]|uniref:peptidoglycan D,D-transpeptidase FtsI family protein n=1 Tax=Planctomicrobium sp. SH661 TaxID=3448124 RepID=UPI003F5CB508
MLPEIRSILSLLLARLLSRWRVPTNPHLTDASSRQSRGPQAPLSSHRTSRPVPVQSEHRERLIHIVLGLAACALLVRFIHIQWVCRDQFASRALRQQISSEPVLARPGDLYDRRGRLLATTVIVPSLYVCPARIKDIPRVSRELASALQLNEATLRRNIEKHSRKQFLWVKRRLSIEESAAVQKLELSPRVYGIRQEFQRHYPQGPLAAHVLGLRDIDGTGRGGVEESLEETLNGKDGIRRFVRDARGYVLNVLEEVTEPPVDGTSVMLTLDVLIQMHVEQQLDLLMEKHQAQGACAIVMNPQNGEILALASRPAFDPNHPELASAEAWKNMATSSVFEPGSTFKPMVVAWGLDHEVIERDAMYDCENGAYRMGRRILHDHHRYGLLSLTDVLVKSSNIGMAKIGEQLGNEELFKLATAFGFGQRTGVELPGELSGLLRPLEQWTSYSTGSIPMGQELAATPMQMITAHATLANQGVRVSPHLVLKSLNDSPQARQVLVSRVLGADAASWVVQGPMLEVVQRGTGKLAQLPDVDVFGKTGTAQKQATDGKGYSSTRNFSSFIGGASADDPQLLVLVSVDEPRGTDQFGGSVAAPFVAAILKQGMAIIGNDQVEPSPVKLATEPEPLGQ